MRRAARTTRVRVVERTPAWWNDSVTWLFALAVILVLGAGFAVALGLLGELPPAEPDLRPDTLDGEPSFDVVLRGYRMDEVDAQLATLQAEIDSLRGSGAVAGDESGADSDR
jgi:hypothetical protein